MVNLSPFEFNANDVITANFELKSTVMTGSTTVFYYAIYDGSHNVKEGNVNTGGSLSGSVQYTVPNVPAPYYRFTIYASGGGHVISGQAQANIVSNFIVTIKFDKTNYNAGDTMSIDYKISARSSVYPLPRIFTLQFGLLGYPMPSVETTSAEGNVKYVVPSGANEGQVLFEMIVSSSSGTVYAYEVVTIGPSPSEISLFDAFLLVLIVILFLLVLAMRGRGAGAKAAEAAPKPKEEKAAPPPPPGAQTSPMIVNCKSCGAPIEITTSKRPIEVMCPSCGETAMVQ
jgi:ribosomal protein S27E